MVMSVEASVPVPESVAPLLTVTLPSPVKVPLIRSSPALTVNPPEWVLPALENTRVPDPVLASRPPAVTGQLTVPAEFTSHV